MNKEIVTIPRGYSFAGIKISHPRLNIIIKIKYNGYTANPSESYKLDLRTLNLGQEYLLAINANYRVETKGIN